MNGILIIDKPVEWTSHDVVGRVRRLLREKRVGHTGTLDPFATGVLVVLVGRATQLAQFFAGAEKEYVATIRFGYATDTGDWTGERKRRSEFESEDETTAKNETRFDCSTLSVSLIEESLQSLRGDIEQVPPMYSAKKIKGQKLYELARRGVEVERAAVRVRISELEMLPRGESVGQKFDEANGVENFLSHNADGTCDLRVRVVCSAGTYIRTLAESIGERLGVGAHLTALRRTRAGAFLVEDAVSLEELKELIEKDSSEDKSSTNIEASTSDEASKSIERFASLAQVFVSPDAALSWMPFVHLSVDDARRVGHGIAVRVDESAAKDWADGEHVRMRDGVTNELIAVGVFNRERMELKSRVLMHIDEKTDEK